MLYQLYQFVDDFMAPVRALADSALWHRRRLFEHLDLFSGPVDATLEMITRMEISHERPPFGIDSVMVDGRTIEVHEEVVMDLPFGTLLHFRKATDLAQPRLLVAAPLSGHFSTLLRGTVQTLLVDHDVFITDWKNARDVPLSAGPFGIDDYVDYLIRFQEAVGPNAHLLAVCQPCVQALAAVAIMSEDKHPATPLSLTLMAGPVDTRESPTEVNELANERSLDWFDSVFVHTVPDGNPGAGRHVEPGFFQLGAFMSMNLDRHLSAHVRLFFLLMLGEHEEAEKIKTFYDEYNAVLDLPAEFYLETVGRIFQDAALARGELTYRGRPVSPKAIMRTALLTIEGGRDDICSVGQTAAAHDLCSSLRPHLKRHHLQANVGHYGVFAGKRWEQEIYPVVRNMTLSMH